MKPGCGNMHIKVTKEQFVLDGDRLTHAPTGATFWLGDKDVVCCEQGRLNLDTGDDYRLDELKNEAWSIMLLNRASEAAAER
jgi:hypothetical protein